MTKEELKQEAEEWIKDHSGLIGSYKFVKYDYDSMQKAYLAGAEPREKKIESLGRRCLQLQKDKGNLTDELTKAIDYIDKEDENYSFIAEADLLKDESQSKWVNPARTTNGSQIKLCEVKE